MWWFLLLMVILVTLCLCDSLFELILAFGFYIFAVCLIKKWTPIELFDAFSMAFKELLGQLSTWF